MKRGVGQEKLVLHVSKRKSGKLLKTEEVKAQSERRRNEVEVHLKKQEMEDRKEAREVEERRDMRKQSFQLELMRMTRDR